MLSDSHALCFTQNPTQKSQDKILPANDLLWVHSGLLWLESIVEYGNQGKQMVCSILTELKSDLLLTFSCCLGDRRLSFLFFSISQARCFLSQGKQYFSPTIVNSTPPVYVQNIQHVDGSCSCFPLDSWSCDNIMSAQFHVFSHNTQISGRETASRGSNQLCRVNNMSRWVYC